MSVNLWPRSSVGTIERSVDCLVGYRKAGGLGRPPIHEAGTAIRCERSMDDEATQMHESLHVLGVERVGGIDACCRRDWKMVRVTIARGERY
jgi:hypothetical protein